MQNKRGLSPIIATVLLISIALILAIIIFLWARGFVAERLVKFEEPIENSCGKISFDAEADSSGEIFITNTGNINIYSVKVSKKGLGSVQELDVSSKDSALPGESKEVGVIDSIDEGDTLLITPIIIGESNRGKVPYTCDNSFGKEITVI